MRLSLNGASRSERDGRLDNCRQPSGNCHRCWCVRSSCARGMVSQILNMQKPTTSQHDALKHFSLPCCKLCIAGGCQAAICIKPAGMQAGVSKPWHACECITIIASRRHLCSSSHNNVLLHAALKAICRSMAGAVGLRHVLNVLLRSRNSHAAI